ncbi:MAG: glycosyltransferase family 2 protein [Phycisphaerales bacterium]|nr:glycosyltransferase family 2 protein [Planctomycetota bacterium]MCH8509223.1 glycosyltransferase family 2 protein [Phycisphaerales bacterium]
MRTLIAIPVFNEAPTVEQVLRTVHGYHPNILIIDDGSTDDTPAILDRLRPELGFDLIRHEANAGYGRAMREAYARAHRDGYDWVITMDCDEQHEPASIPDFLAAAARDDLDIVSGSRYLDERFAADRPPEDRRAINATLTREINERLGLKLTDAFCGFKAHRVPAMRRLHLTDDGYAFPMQLWAEAAAKNLRIGEIPVRLIYKDLNRTFGDGLDIPTARLRHYREVLDAAIARNQQPACCRGPRCDG